MVNHYDNIYLYKNVNPDILDIKVFASNPSMMETGELMRITPQIRQSTWFTRASESPALIQLEYMKIPKVYFDTGKNLVFTKYLNDRYSDLEMVIVLAISPAKLQQILEKSIYPALITDDGELVLYAKDMHLAGRQLSDVMDAHSTGSYSSEEYYKLDTPLTIQGSLDSLHLVTFVPLLEITKAVNFSLVTGLSVIFFCMLFVAFLVTVFSKGLSSRIKKLRDYTWQVAQGNLDITPDIKGSDEVGQLASDLAVMTGCIHQLLIDNEEHLLRRNALEIQHKNAQLRVLANQVNPHFLFNTLDAIRMNLLREKDTKTAEAIQILASILRSSLETGSRPIPLDVELKTAENYLYLMKYRFTNSFDFKIQNENVDINLPVLPFIIQPLVENAVIHGLDNCPKEGFIEVRVFYDKLSAGDILIQITDNGIGMSLETVAQIEASLKKSPYEQETGRIGISNVHKRLMLYYGQAYGIAIHSTAGGGTTVTARIAGA